jgi:hypothetical protein
VPRCSSKVFSSVKVPSPKFEVADDVRSSRSYS